MNPIIRYRRNSQSDDYFALVLLLLPLSLCFNWSFQGAIPFWVVGLLLSWRAFPYYRVRRRWAWSFFFSLLTIVVSGNALLEFNQLGAAWAFFLGKLLLFALALPTAAHVRGVGERG